MKTLVIVPAYQAAKTIAAVIASLRPLSFVSEIVVVDDGSDDGTEAVARATGVTVLRHAVNRDQGAALETGHQYALQIGADIVVDFDADGQHRAEDIAVLLEYLWNDKVDIVLGSRFLGATENLPWSKKWLILKPGIALNNFLTGLKLTDAHNGFRAFNRVALEKIRITQDRKAHATEIPYLVKKHNLRYMEAPVTIIYNSYGQNMAGGFKIIKELFWDKFLRF